MTVPSRAVLEGPQGRFVYVVADNKAMPKPVQVGDQIGDQWIINQGLAAGDQVIVDGMARIFFPGAPVQIAQAPAGGASAPGARRPRPPAAAPAPRARSSPPRRRRPPRSKPLATHNKRGTSMFSRFFIDRPIFAAVLAIFIVIAGLSAMRTLPIAQYPEIAPPVVTVLAVYPGASAEVIEQTVAAPLENAINGVEHMIYMGSTSTSNGVVHDPGHVRHRHRRRPGRAAASTTASSRPRPSCRRRCGARASRWRRAPRRSCRCWRSSPTTAARTT